MTSKIDATQPPDITPVRKENVRANFAAAKSEIEDLQWHGVSVVAYGAKCDCKRFAGTGSITAGSAELTVSNGTFDASDVGKNIEVERAKAQTQIGRASCRERV